MKRQPDVFSPQQIQQWDVQVEFKLHHGPKVYSTWLPGRSEGHTLRPFWYRVRTAWRVFIGRYDALDWEPDAKTKDAIREGMERENADMTAALLGASRKLNTENGGDFAGTREVARRQRFDNTITLFEPGIDPAIYRNTASKPRPPEGRVGQEYEMPTRHSSFIADTEPNVGSSYSESSGGSSSD
jgi:hypothetical protein